MTARPALPRDAGAMAELLNEIIRIGGTTAHEAPKSPDQVRNDYIDGPEVLTSVVVEEKGRLLGWQSVGWWQGEAHIGTFVRTGQQAKGIGATLFARTSAAARAKGLTEIIASIRADNVPGLAYYARLGFADVGADPEFALGDGTVVGRIHRRFDLTRGP